MTACCECKTCNTIDKMGGNILRFLNPWRRPGQPSHRLDYTPSFTQQGKQHQHENRAEICSQIDDDISLLPGIRNELELWSLKFHPQIGHTTAWDPFPTGTPDVLCHETSQHCLSLHVGKNPIWCCILCSFYFSFLLMLVY